MAKNFKPWTPAEDALLGKASDGEIAKRLNRPRSTVQERRVKQIAPGRKVRAAFRQKQNKPPDDEAAGP